MAPDVLVGTVRSPELARATLAVGTEQHQRQLGDHVVVGFDDGSERRLIVEAPHVLTKHETRDQWEDLAGDPLAALFLDVAPGDHVKCELDGWRIQPGTRIAFAHDGDVIRIIAVVERDDATAVDEVGQILRERAARISPPPPAPKPPADPPPKKPWRRSVAVLGGLGLVGVVVTALTWFDPRMLLAKDHDTPVAIALMVPSAVVIAMALLLVMARPWFEVVDTHATPGRFRAPWSKGGLVAGLTMGALTTDLCFALPFVSWSPQVVMVVRFFALALVVVIALVLALHSQRPQRRLAKLLRSGTIVHGTLVASRPPLATSVRYDVHARTQGSGDRQRTTFWYDGVRTARVAEPFAIESRGQRMEVTGERILWGAPVDYVRLTSTEQSGTVIAKTHAQIEPGASVLVRGKTAVVDGVPTFQATGAESFVMFGARGDASSVLRGLLVRWYGLAAVLALLAIGSVALGVYLAAMTPAPPPRPVPAERPY